MPDVKLFVVNIEKLGIFLMGAGSWNVGLEKLT